MTALTGNGHASHQLPRRKPAIVVALALVVAFGLVGALAGTIWELVWTPPTGLAIDGQWLLDERGVPAEFSGTGSYVLVGLLAGIVVGVVATFAARGREVVVVLVGILASALGAWVALTVGHSLGPPDPGTAAKTAADYTAIVSDLRVNGWSAYLSWPIGFSLGSLVMLLIPPSAHSEDHQTNIEGPPNLVVEK